MELRPSDGKDANGGTSLILPGDSYVGSGAVNYISFGHYEQDGNLRNGIELIEWEILKEDENGLLLISRYILDYKHINTENEATTWASSVVREWLNNEFYDTAFSESEKQRIAEVINEDNPVYGTPRGNDTSDKIFLSVDEILDLYSFNELGDDKYPGCSEQLMTEPTVYASEQYEYSTAYGITRYDYDSIADLKGMFFAILILS